MHRTRDIEQIKRILDHPSIDSPECVADNESIYWLVNDEEDCLCVAYPYTDKVYMCHIYIKEEARGTKAIRFGRAGVKWYLANTDAKKLTGFTPSYMKHAYIYAMQIGFKKQGFFKDSIEHNGKNYGHYIMGINSNG